MPTQTEFVIPEDLSGERADLVVARLGGLSRAQARSMCDSGLVTVDGALVAPKSRVAAGSTVSMTLPEAEPSFRPGHVEYGIAHEDDTLLVVDKPPGLVVHPGAGHRHDTLANGLVERYPDLLALGADRRWGIVHRLDRDTSGLLLVARTPEVHQTLQRAMKRRAISRTYLALVDGHLPAATGTIEAEIGRDPGHPTRMAVVRSGRPARTHYRVLAKWDGPDLTLAEVALETGRTHQIRVHFASIGHPLAGDRTYNRRPPTVTDPPRVWLHAARLAFEHPVEGVEVVVESPLPSDLADHLARLGPPSAGSVAG